MARPAKLTADVEHIICEALREGASLADACARVGVARSTLFEWLARGRGHDGRRTATSPYIEFAAAVDAILDAVATDAAEFADCFLRTAPSPQ